MSDILPLSPHPATRFESGPTAVYYPHIHFRSRRWLRMALLYYESVSRIVPAGFDPEESTLYVNDAITAPGLFEEVSELRSVGFIRDESPSDSVKTTGDEFFSFYAVHLTDPDRRRRLLPSLAGRG